MEIFRTEVINILRLLGGLNVDRVKSLVKAIRRPGGAAIGTDVSETAEHHLIVACHICKYWRRTSRQSKNYADLVTTSDLFEEAGRKWRLKRLGITIKRSPIPLPVPKLIKTSTFSTKSSRIVAPLFAGCTNNPISYLMRKILIPKDEADNPEEEYVMLDQ